MPGGSWRQRGIRHAVGYTFEDGITGSPMVGGSEDPPLRCGRPSVNGNRRCTRLPRRQSCIHAPRNPSSWLHRCCWAPACSRRLSRDVVMSETSPRVAFIAAALVLLVMPMIFVVGLDRASADCGRHCLDRNGCAGERPDADAHYHLGHARHARRVDGRPAPHSPVGAVVTADRRSRSSKRVSAGPVRSVTSRAGGARGTLRSSGDWQLGASCQRVMGRPA